MLKFIIMGIVSFSFILCILIAVGFICFKICKYFGADISYEDYNILSISDIIDNNNFKSHFTNEMENEYNIFKNICNRTNEKLIHHYKVNSNFKMYFCYNGKNKISVLCQKHSYLTKECVLSFINDNMNVLARKSCAIDDDMIEHLLTQNRIKTNIIKKTEIISNLIKEEKEKSKIDLGMYYKKED